MVDEHAQRDRAEKEGEGDGECCGVVSPHGFRRIPGALFFLAESAQIHRIGDGLDTVQRGENQRNRDVQDVLDALAELFLFRQV